MKKKIELVVLIFLVAGLAVLNKNLEEQVSSPKITVRKNTVVLDAGHGAVIRERLVSGMWLKRRSILQSQKG